MPSGSLLDEYPVLASGFRPAHPLAPVKTLAWSLVPGPWPALGPRPALVRAQDSWSVTLGRHLASIHRVVSVNRFAWLACGS